MQTVTITRREFCAALAGVSLLCAPPVRLESVGPAPEWFRKFFTVAPLPELFAHRRTFARHIDLLANKTFGTAVVLVGESFVPRSFVDSTAQRFLANGINPLVRTDDEILSVAAWRKIAPHTLAEFQDEKITALLFLDTARGRWQRYAAASPPKYSPPPIRLRTARCIDQALKITS